MTQALALVVYEKLLPGTQLVNRLQDLSYRVQSVGDPERLVELAEQARPMLVLADLESTRASIPAAIARLKQNPATSHVPVIVFSRNTTSADLQAGAREAGATLMVSDTAVLNHLPELLEQALQVE